MTDEEIYLLDVVQRSDNESFDREAGESVRLSAEQKRQGRLKAAHMLGFADASRLQGASILEVGCGMGDLTSALAMNERLSACQVHAFDHSLESLRVARRSIEPRNGNQLFLSTQDASALSFRDASFDFVLGSAVLHHILDYRSFLAAMYRVLKPGGHAVFCEPFLEGYVWPAAVLRMACRATNVDPRDAGGLAEFILNDTTFRLEHADDAAALDALTDKHYFRNDTLSAVSAELGFRKLAFRNYEPPEFYDHYIDVFLVTYGIDHPGVVATSKRFWADLRSLLGTKLPELVSHFKYFALQK